MWKVNLNTHFITFSNDKYNLQKKIAVDFALRFGKFDSAIGYSPSDIDCKFLKDNDVILGSSVGLGYWLWKPYFIFKRLQEIEMGDYLFYADAGSFFIRDINILIEILASYEQDVFGFDLPFIEKQWTKKELFLTLNCDYGEYKNTNQVNGSFHLVRKTPDSIKFYKNYLREACCIDNITDLFISKDQDDSFIQHRYDQSIFSLLYKKNNYQLFKDPSQFGLHPFLYLGLRNVEYDQLVTLPSGVMYNCVKPEVKFPVLIFHYRKNNPIYRYVIYWLNRVFNFPVR